MALSSAVSDQPWQRRCNGTLYRSIKAVTFRKGVTPGLPFMHFSSTVAAVFHCAHLTADWTRPPFVNASTFLTVTIVLD
ncbi:hypothetical protein KBY65_12935 [Cyanobium sp. Alchichica 3B3-8F6]|nr:hypothetical protein [Cyanobium sp. Alchichica 3B3-8F6]